MDGWSSWKNIWTSIFRHFGKSLFLDFHSKNRTFRILLALNNIWTLKIILFSWRIDIQSTDCLDQLAKGIMQFIELLVVHAWRNLVRTQVAEFGEVGEVVGGVGF